MKLLLKLLLPLAVAAGLAGSAPAALAQDLPQLGDLTDRWLASPHADYHAQSFSHWNEEGAVPPDCAACHSGHGFVDYLGADGSAAGAVDAPAPVQSPVSCVSCHTTAAHDLDRVTFPSGVAVDGLGASATCMVCHQGRQSADVVARAIGALEEDEVSEELGFVNIHYSAAAATLMGSRARGGYQYPDRRYAGRFTHVPSADTCVDCHEPHTTQVATDGCLSCHRGVEEIARMRTRHADFDGDGDRSEGIHGEIVGLHERLGAAIAAYARQVAGRPILYAPGRHPYFFADSDADGEASEAETVYANRYRLWTPRLLKAAYNYQFVASDRGGYAHNPAYMLQLLYDSLESLSQLVDVEMSSLNRP